MRKNNTSHLAAALQSAMQKNGVKAIDVARKTKALGRSITGSSISRIINGDQGFVTNGDLEILARAISRDPADRAAIYRGRLFDQSPNEAFSLLTIEFGKKAKQTRFTAAGQEAMHYLAERATPQLEATIIEIARLIGMKP